MYKRLSAVITISLVCVGLIVFSHGVKSDTATYSVTSGIDNTAGTMRVLSSADLTQLATSDNSRNGTTANWPYAVTYDEAKYIEFAFDPNLPGEALISAVTVTHQYYTQATLSGAKFEVWDGTNWQDVTVSLPPKTGSAGEFSEVKDISVIVASPAIANALKIRFLAYRSTNLSNVANLKTFHNYISLSIAYTMPSPTPADSILATPTPSPMDTLAPDASASATVSPSPTITPEISVSPTPTLIPDTPQPTLTPDFTPFIVFVPPPDIVITSESDEPLASDSFEIPSPSPTSSPSPLVSPIPESTPSASFEETPNPLVALIAPPKIIHYRLKPTPPPSASPTPIPKPSSRIRRMEISVVNIWHLFTHYINMIGR